MKRRINCAKVTDRMIPAFILLLSMIFSAADMLTHAEEPQKLVVSYNDKGKPQLPKGYKFIREEQDDCFTVKHDGRYTTYTKDGFPLGSSHDGWHFIEKILDYGGDKYYQIAYSNQYRNLCNSVGKLIVGYDPDKKVINFHNISGEKFFKIYNKFLERSYIILPDGTEVLTAKYIDPIETDKGVRFILKNYSGNTPYTSLADISGKILIPEEEGTLTKEKIGGRDYFTDYRKHPLSASRLDYGCAQAFDANGQGLPDVLKSPSSYIELDGHPFFILQKYSKGFGGKLEKGSCYVFSPDFDLDVSWADDDKALAVDKGKLVKTAADNSMTAYDLPTASSHVSTAEKAPAPIVAAEQTPVAVDSDVDKNIPVGTRQRDKTFVLIIANENYQEVAKVPYALNDGNVFEKYCVTTLGIPQKNIRHLSDATLNQMRRQIGWLKDVAEAYGTEASVIVYYSGHGIPTENGGEAYLLPVDGYTSDIASNYSMKELNGILSGLPSKTVTLILDACFTGALRGDGMMMAAKGVSIKPKPTEPQGNLIVLSAAQGDQTAYPIDDKRHGALTYFMLKKLQQTRGETTIGDLGDYISSQVKRWSLVEKSKLQQPTIQTSPSLVPSWRTIQL